MHVNDILIKATELAASDIHITVGSPIVFRIGNHLTRVSEYKLTPRDTEAMALSIMNDAQKAHIDKVGDVDFSYAIAKVGRFRVNAFKQRGSYSLAMRVVALKVPPLKQLGLPDVLKQLTQRRRGLILVTGPTGSGKSTTLAAMLDLINQTRNEHIITIEDPIEYLHRHQASMINQREIGLDTYSFADALRAALRQDPDIILVGEMRDLETISTALTAAETGHLVLSTLHTIGAAKTIDRIIDVFPPHQQGQIRVQLASVIDAVISQQLLPRRNGKGREVATEILIANHAARNIIREGKTHQLQTVIQTGKSKGMMTMDDCLVDLYKRGLIEVTTLKRYAVDGEAITKYL